MQKSLGLITFSPLPEAAKTLALYGLQIVMATFRDRSLEVILLRPLGSHSSSLSPNNNSNGKKDTRHLIAVFINHTSTTSICAVSPSAAPRSFTDITHTSRWHHPPNHRHHLVLKNSFIHLFTSSLRQPLSTFRSWESQAWHATKAATIQKQQQPTTTQCQCHANKVIAQRNISSFRPSTILNSILHKWTPKIHLSSTIYSFIHSRRWPVSALRLVTQLAIFLIRLVISFHSSSLSC